MPTLRIFDVQRDEPGPGRAVPLKKPLTSLGSGPDNDVVLADPALPETCAHILFDGRDHDIVALAACDLLVDGKRRPRHRFRDGDRVRLGATEISFEQTDPAPGPSPELRAGLELGAYRRLFDFSARLLQGYDPGPLLETLLDAVIEITQADKGFLVLLESGEPQVKVARNLLRENIADAVEQLSDSILAKVIRERRPVMVSDAQSDAEFQAAASVVSLKLSSAMCVPLLDRDEVLGALYLGSNRVAHLFEETSLEVLVVFAAQASLLLRNALFMNELIADKSQLSERLEKLQFGEILGACPAMQEIFRKVEKVATTEISVLLTGETGTGKELVAREIHGRSPRAAGPFVGINCGAIPESLLESELFGHVRGAFTGAVATRPGKFHAAAKGTLFLDEIGEMPLPLQVKILRALQDKAVVRVGDTRPEEVDIRVVAATNKALEQEIALGRFREDLYYRLNVINLHLPPLRERGEDVVMLARYLFSRYAQEYQSKARGFSAGALAAIRRYSWPGNIREMENRIKKAVVFCEGGLLAAEDLGLGEAELPPILPLAQAKEEFQRRYINEVLLRNGGNRTKAARDLGVDPRTIFRHLEREEELAEEKK
jgi:transcriptional regulator with GAF, ATPase, and Fis domain